MYYSDIHVSPEDDDIWFEIEANWKSTHVLTENNKAFPIEMFIAVMEQKHKFGKQTETNMVVDALSAIPESGLSTENGAITLWKQQNLDRLLGLQWDEFKHELLQKFGRSSKYDSNAKSIFLQSIGRGQKERLDVFLIRINMIVCYIEYGEILEDYLPSEAWVKVLLLLGLDSESKKHLPTDVDAFTADQVCKHIASQCPKLFFEATGKNNRVAETIQNSFRIQELELNKALSKDENYINIKIEKEGEEDQGGQLQMKLEDFSTDNLCSEEINPDVDNKSEYRKIAPAKRKRRKRRLEVTQTPRIAKKSNVSLSPDSNQGDEHKYKGATYTCSECEQTFENEIKRDFHVKVKHTRYLSCNICSETLDGSIRSYALHKKEVHGDGRLCEICDQFFDTKEDVKEHQDDVHLGAQYKCKLCPAEIKYATIKSHMEKVHNPEKPFERRPWVRQHRRKKCPSTPERKQIIKNLSRMSHAHLHGSMSLQEYLTYYKHIAIYQHTNVAKSQNNSDENNFSCGLCDEKLHSVSNMKKHFENKHEGKKFKCDECEYLGKRLDNLAHHRFNRHGLSSQGYDIIKCSEPGCKYSAVFPDKMALHNLSKHNIESERYETLTCDYGGCDYRTVDPKLLRIHVDGVHNNIRNPRYASANKTFRCIICKTSDNKESRCEHYNEAELLEVKPYKCEHSGCDKEFTSLHSCRSHLETVHLGIRKFKCDACKKCYSAKPALENHKKRVHGSGEVKKHVCHVCGMETVHYANFKRHLVQVHGEPGPKSFQILKDESKDEDASNLCPCPTCGRLFHSEIKRNAHMLSHTRWKTCSICFMSLGVDGSTGSWDAYKEHKERFHGNGKLCEVCNTLFENVESVKKHQDEQHSGAQYKCKHCPAELKYKTVKQHMEKVHKMVLS